MAASALGESAAAVASALAPAGSDAAEPVGEAVA